MDWMIDNGTVEDILPGYPENYFSGCLCDPPYGLEFMGKEWDHGVPGKHIWAEILRVLKPGAMLLAFGGTRTHHRLMCSIEDAGFEIRDCLMWIYGTGFPKSLDISKAIDKAAGAERKIVGSKIGLPGYSLKHQGKGGILSGREDGSLDNSEGECAITEAATPEAHLWSGYGTALKPAWEPIILAMKPCEGTFAENALKWGVAGLAIDAGRIATVDNLNGGACAKQGNRQPLPGDSRTGAALGMLQQGKTADSEYVQPQGSWPSNLILDEESAKMLDSQTGNRPGCKSPSSARPESKFRPGQGNYQPQGPIYPDDGGASRFFYTSKASKSERGEGNNHPTVKPLKLCEYLARLILPPQQLGHTLLVPFSGSGSEMIGASNAGWDGVCGIECVAEYVSVAERRLQENFKP